MAKHILTAKQHFSRISCKKEIKLDKNTIFVIFSEIALGWYPKGTEKPNVLLICNDTMQARINLETVGLAQCILIADEEY